MSNRAEVYFALFGDFDPSALSLGIAPTKTRVKGTPRPKRSAWIYSGGRVEGEVVDVYQLASSVVKALEPHKDGIKDAKRRLGLDAVLEVVLTISPDEQISTPIIGFESDVISFLGEVGASIDIDTYRG